MPKDKRTTLQDRLAIAFLSGFLALVTGCVAWLIFAGINNGGAHFGFIPLNVILGFAVIMSLIGFFKMDNVMLLVFEKIWSGLAFMLGIEKRGL